MVTFDAKLIRPEGTGTWTYLSVPFNVEETYGKKGQVKVKGTINGVDYRGTLQPHGDGRHYLVVNKALRDAANVQAGDIAEVTMEKDNEKRVVQTPDDLLHALQHDLDAAEIYQKLAYSHQKAYVEWIEEAKKQETRKNRVAKTIEKLKAGQKLK